MTVQSRIHTYPPQRQAGVGSAKVSVRPFNGGNAAPHQPPSQTARSFQLGHWSVSPFARECAIVAWSLVLSRITSRDAVIFLLNGKRVRFNLSGKTIRDSVNDSVDVENDDAHETDNIDDTCISALVFEDEYNAAPEFGHIPQQIRLILVLNLVANTGTLIAFEGKTNLNREIITWTPPRFLKAAEQISSYITTPPISSISILSDSEKRHCQAFETTPDPRENQRNDFLLHELFEQRAHEYPNEPAIQFMDDQVITYAQLNAQANQLAHFLRATGVHADVVVPICLEKSTEMYVSMLAVLKAGGAWIPLDPDTPKSRLHQILEIVGDTPIAIVSRSTKSLLEERSTPSAVLEDLQPALARLPSSNFTTDTRPHHLCHVLFTSGSTGVPKGVMIEHRNEVNAIFWLKESAGINNKTRTLQFATYTFDVCMLDIMTTLSEGGCLYTAPKPYLLNNLNDFIYRKQITAAHLTPTVISLLEKGEKTDTLKVLISSGEAITEPIISTWDHITLLNVCGPSELIFCTINAVHENPVTSCIGLSGYGMGCVVVDDEAGFVPIGGVGELCCRGPQIFRGYYGNPELTRKTQIPLEGKTYFRTGDLVRFDNNGGIHYIGRKDHQIKLRGQRIDLGDVEQGISSSGRTHYCMTCVPRRGPAKDRLVALLSLKAVESSTEDNVTFHPPEAQMQLHEEVKAISAHVCERLPPYMVPNAWITLRSMPRTASGKVHRVNLKAWLEGLSVEEYERITGTSPKIVVLDPDTREYKLQRAFAKVLKATQETIPLNESFFNIGGDSISAIFVVAAARNEGVAITVQDIFTAKTIEKLALVGLPLVDVGLADKTSTYDGGCIGSESDEVRAEVAQLCQISVDDIEDLYECTPLQEGLMALTMRTPWSYVCQYSASLPADVDIERFHSAVEAVAAANPILRTRIVYHTNSAKSLQVVIKGRLQWELAEDLEEYLDKNAREGITYGRPLSRFGTIHQNGYWSFLLTMHHALYDGWSLPLLEGEIRKAYLGKPDITKRTSFKTFVNYLRKVQNDEKSEAAEYWTSELAGSPAVGFPEVPPNVSPNTEGMRKLKVVLKYQSISENITTNTLIRVAWALLLTKYLDSSDVCFGATMSGRNAPVPGVERMTGPTIVTLPIRIRFDPNQPLSELLHDIWKQSIEMIPYEHVGLQYISRLNPDCARACNFRNLLVIQPSHSTKGSFMDEFPMGNFQDLRPMIQNHPLTMECSLLQDGIDLVAYHDQSILKEGEVDSLLQHFSSALRNLVSVISEAPKSRIGDLRIFGEDNLLQQQLKFNTPCPPLVERCIHEMIEEQAALHPHNVALRTTEGTMTYGEVDGAATRLASLLVDHGVGPETIVPVFFEKSMAIWVAVLAVWKAGGAYLPCDVSWPASRCEHIFEQSGTKLILTSPLYAHIFDSTNINTLAVDLGLVKKLPMPQTRIGERALPQNAAYIIYTSGSTGKPKGVVIEHGNICTQIAQCGGGFGLSGGTNMLQFSAHTFDASVLEAVGTLCYGGTLCIPTEHQRLNGLEQVINVLKVDSAILTPTVVALLSPVRVPTLKQLCLVGEPATDVIIHTWADHVSLRNGYGPTETAIACSVNQRLSRETSKSNVGTRVGGLVWIVDQDDHNQLAPFGFTGEIVVTGHTLARAYHNDPVKTANAFIENPAWFPKDCPELGPSRLYKTGDLGRFNPDGSIEILGRKDQQVKLHGLRIECGEIEHAISLCGGVQNSAVLLAKLGTEHKDGLVAFITVEDQYLDNPRALGESAPLVLPLTAKLADLFTEIEVRLLSSLPSYMLPVIYIPLAKIPQQTSGKTDRNALRGLLTDEQISSFRSAGSMQRKGRRPTTLHEKKMHELWVKVLGGEVQDCSTSDSFFRLGGDSISAINLVSLANNEGIRLSVRDIFQNPELESMVDIAVFSNSHPSTASNESMDRPFSLLDVPNTKTFLYQVSERLNVDAELIEDVYPAGEIQVSSLVVGTRENNPYYGYFVCSIKGPLDSKKLRQACEKFVQKTPILRTRIFMNNEGHIYQAVLDGLPITFLTYHDGPSRLKEQFLKGRGRQSRFGEQLCEFELVVHDPETATFTIGISHALYDAFTVPMLFRDIRTAYLHGAESVSSRPSYKSFVRLEQEQAQSEAALAYWRGLLIGSTMTEILDRSSMPHLRKPIANKVSAVVPALKDLPPTVTPASIMKAAWAITLAQFRGTRGTGKIVFGHIISGRNSSHGVKDIIGPCINILPVAVDTNDTVTVKNILDSVMQQHVECMPYENVPFRTIVEKCTDWKKNTKYSSFVQYLTVDMSVSAEEGGDSAGLKWVYEDGYAGMGDEVDIGLACAPKSNMLDVSIYYAEDVIGKTLAQRLLDMVCYNLETIARDLETPVKSFFMDNNNLEFSFPIAPPLNLSRTPEEEENENSRTYLGLRTPPDTGSNTTPPSWESSFPNKARHALPYEELSRRLPQTPNSSVVGDPHTSPNYTILRELWKSLLPMVSEQEISATANFFELGGDSLLAAALWSKCKAKGLRLEIRQIWEYPTLHGMVDCARQMEY